LNKNMPGMLAHANNVLESTDKITKDIATVDISATMAKVDATLANVQQLSAKLNSNDGTLGLLIRDPSLYNNLTATMRDADSLLIDLKAHPKRYVHFSIFGRKDKQ
ncbi:MAG: MCE family protein, partial [Prevotella sp.]|nr:MCE family protein [Prevotella sp.]